MEAANYGHLGMVALLLKNKANAEATNKYGKTALMYAASKGHQEIVALLLENKANADTHK